ncbi:MAG TPA: hypothetical protein VIV40_22980, partial [Kofleriaceae bacterium]
MCAACKLLEARYVTDADFREWKATWEDEKTMTYEEVAASVARRAEVDDQREREWTWPVEAEPPSYDAVSDRTKRAAKLAELFEDANYTRMTVGNDGLEYSYHKRLPQNPELFARVLAEVESDEPRQLYAKWMRTTDDARAPEAADFIDGQLSIARSLRDDPRADFTKQLPVRSFESPQSYPDWWRYPDGGHRGLAGALSDNLEVLVDEGLIADLRWYRGFVEHVTVKAHRFVEIADELFEAAPIRHLTITCAKGLDHQDVGVWKALLASPHLARMRSLRFPARNVDHPLAELNRVTDSDIELLATSPHVKGLRYLEFTDARALTIRAFEALARSPKLPELSAVRHDLYRYEQLGNFGFASVGPHQQTAERSPLAGWRVALEKAHG